jgi:2-succinyl-5-enolpyruvyl-6-hydroxy-3-cyclohexene-1-carboxylate synthase
MTAALETYVLLRAFVDELARCGMRAACTSPGSRSTPIVLSLAREQRVRCYSHIDERSAGFFALGLAKASGLPVAVACTSGTAAAELLPAAVEAHEARVPLLLLTADRPPELRENGAGQAIDQLKLYGGAAKWFFELAPRDASEGQLRWIRTLACRAFWTALEGRPGVVHLNLPLREPLVSDEPLPEDRSGRRDGAPFVRRPPPPGPAPSAARGELRRLLELVRGARRGVLVAGRHERATPLGAAAGAFAQAAGWPLLADPLSGARRGVAAVAHYDALLRDRAFATRLEPDVVIRVGDLPVSKPLRDWLAGLGQARQLALDPEGAWQDPASVVSESLSLEPAATLAELARALGEEAERPADEWLASWLGADVLAAQAIAEVLAGQELSEPAVARELAGLPAAEATLFVASSMPVREIETFWPARADPPRVLCNRGANGIDGTASSAFGAAAAGERALVLLIGDVALAYDIGALLAARRLDARVAIVLLNNGGGGIFDFLAVSRIAEHELYERHVATAPGLDFAAAASAYGLAYECPRELGAFRAALARALEHEGSSIVEVRCSRAHNVELHARVWEAVSRALSRPAGGAAPAA